MPRSDIYKQRKIDRPKLDPYSAIIRQDEEQGKSEDGQERAVPSTDAHLARLQFVPVDRLKGSHYQHRDELNVAEDKEYRQLLAQVQADLALQPDEEHRTIEHVFIVMPDPKDEQKLILASGGHRRFQVCLDL